jgi:SAM-dependent methyltransferase
MSLQKILRWVSFNLRYFGKPPWDTNQSPPELMEFIQSHQAGSALDLGCGTGTNCLALSKAGWRTSGVDLAWRAIRKARLRFIAAGLDGQFSAGNIIHLDVPEAEFDLILDIGCFHSLPEEDRDQYQDNVSRWLKPGGSFLIYGHRPSARQRSEASLSDQDIAKFQKNLTLTNRNDCEDRRGRQTVWLWFAKPVR